MTGLQEQIEIARYRAKRERQFCDVYMQMALAVASLSYCQKKKVGVVIVNQDNVVGYGFNGSVKGMPNICEDDEGCDPRAKDVHAEMNAVLKAGIKCQGADAYSTCYPCEPCARLMAQAGIRRVFYLDEYKIDGRVEMYGMQAIKLEL